MEKGWLGNREEVDVIRKKARECGKGDSAIQGSPKCFVGGPH
jgi:hypothetical protein